MYYVLPKDKAERTDREKYNEIQILYCLKDHEQMKKNKWLLQKMWE